MGAHLALNLIAPVDLTRYAIAHFRDHAVVRSSTWPVDRLTAVTTPSTWPTAPQGAIAELPLGEVTPPEDVAKTMAFLASGRARHATGATVDITGADYVR